LGIPPSCLSFHSPPLLPQCRRTLSSSYCPSGLSRPSCSAIGPSLCLGHCLSQRPPIQSLHSRPLERSKHCKTSNGCVYCCVFYSSLCTCPHHPSTTVRFFLLLLCLSFPFNPTIIIISPVGFTSKLSIYHCLHFIAVFHSLIPSPLWLLNIYRFIYMNCCQCFDEQIIFYFMPCRTTNLFLGEKGFFFLCILD